MTYTCTRPNHDATWDGLCRGTHRDHGTTDEQITEWQTPTIETLIAEATEAAEWRGHSLDWDWETNPATVATGVCGCGTWVQVMTDPPANGIDIGGPAVAVNH